MLAWCLAHLHALKCDRRAVTTLEYGLIAAMIAAVIVKSMFDAGTHLKQTFNIISSEL